MLSSAVSSLTTGFSSLFSWKAAAPAADPVETKITEMKVFPGEKQMAPVSEVSKVPKVVASVTEAVIPVMETTMVTETNKIENVTIISEPVEIPVTVESVETTTIVEPVEIPAVETITITEPVETVITSGPTDNTVPVIEQAEIITVEPVEAEQTEMPIITTEAKEEEIIIQAVESAIIETTPTETSVEIAETVLEPVIETATSTDTNLMQTALSTVIESVLMQVIESKHEETSDTREIVSELIEIPLIEDENIETPVVIPVEAAVIESSVSIPESPIQETFIPLSETIDIPMAAFTPLPDELPTIITTTTIATIESPKMNDISYQEEQLDKKQQETIVDDFVDPNDYWYKSPADDELEFDSDEEEDLFERHLTGSYYAIDSYINFSQDSFISIKPIPKKNQSSKKVGIKVHFEPMVELMDNVVNNDKAAIKKVLQEGQINVNDNDKLGYTMLHYAASHNHADLIKYLIEKEGADVNCVDPSDWTPLHLAAIADNLKACKVLLDHDANLEYPNCDNNLPVDLTEDVKVKKLFADATKKKLSAKKVRALYDWEADSPEYLSLRKSEGLKVLDRKNEFWLVQNEFKQIGLVPRIYIQ